MPWRSPSGSVSRSPRRRSTSTPRTSRSARRSRSASRGTRRTRRREEARPPGRPRRLPREAAGPKPRPRRARTSCSPCPEEPGTAHGHARRGRHLPRDALACGAERSPTPSAATARPQRRLEARWSCARISGRLLALVAVVSSSASAPASPGSDRRVHADDWSAWSRSSLLPERPGTRDRGRRTLDLGQRRRRARRRSDLRAERRAAPGDHHLGRMERARSHIHQILFNIGSLTLAALAAAGDLLHPPHRHGDATRWCSHALGLARRRRCTSP